MKLSKLFENKPFPSGPEHDDDLAWGDRKDLVRANAIRRAARVRERNARRVTGSRVDFGFDNPSKSKALTLDDPESLQGKIKRDPSLRKISDDLPAFPYDSDKRFIKDPATQLYLVLKDKPSNLRWAYERIMPYLEKIGSKNSKEDYKTALAELLQKGIVEKIGKIYKVV